jgi:hypothetical protein
MHERAIDLIHRIAVGHDLDLIEPELSREVDAIDVASECSLIPGRGS